MTDAVDYHCAFCGNDFTADVEHDPKTPTATGEQCPECDSRATGPAAFNPY